ncbi:maleylpyruvate isomerase family mycothiol-dependent enzyme [Actinotalea sp. M2MS4P-6]|uniref:maleylpyruvate isomerase family mycothiol-dependent enzyme n=1 Tax=Actinotalea sp. M2MS4P-6 TaxID=2983762 RepID=UPI0021E5153F|nr:maleylpyruvate isomerase family mycothiol-dependent enzyme [Actinotalea sp. M2MS4P-6]MCV2393941.1 maleylpyruvate isomerase family mycothiol-dependent enzyme [Actinotalea sp. M2MS4P-6]
MSLDHLDRLAAAQSAFADLLAAADPEAPVVSCDPWRVADLALHLGGVHWWASAMSLGVDLDPHEPPGPRDTPTLLAFYTWSAAHLRETLAARPTDAPALTLDGPGTAGFWRRRQLHETLVHLADLALATGTDLRAIDDRYGLTASDWTDTVAELLDTMTPRQVRLGRIEPPADTAELVTEDADVLRLGDGEPVVRVVGPARSLALLLWHRTGPDDASLAVSGDRAALDRLLALRLTP